MSLTNAGSKVGRWQVCSKLTQHAAGLPATGGERPSTEDAMTCQTGDATHAKTGVNLYILEAPYLTSSISHPETTTFHELDRHSIRRAMQ